MPQPFLTQLEHIGRRRGRRRWLAATCWAVAAGLVAAMVLAGLDRALGIADPLGRVFLTIAFVGLCAGIVRRWFRAVSANRVPPLQIAQEVEQRHPALRGVVANAWEFSQQADDDPTAGSESLRRAVVLRAATTVDDVDWQQLIPRQPLLQAAFALASVGITTGILGWCLPQSLEIGISRLVNPLSAVEWPRAHDLQFVQPPALMAVGEDLVLELRDTRTALPASITMHYRTRRKGRWHEETQPFLATADSLEIRRQNVQKSLQYRATGGDHLTMPWQSLEVVTPPRVESLQVILHPPAYTKLPVQPWDKGAAIYAGSELGLHGRTDQPVTHVVLQSASGIQRPARVGPEGRSFRLEYSDWRVERSDTYSLQLTTAAGLSTRAATELVLEVVADRPPQVRFIQPAGDLTVLPSVAVPLVIEASDELAVCEIELVYRQSDRSGEDDKRLSLWRKGVDRAAADAARQQRVDFLWQLETLSLQPGSVVEVHAQASDAQPATGQTSRALRLHVVSAEELWHQILEQQTRLVETLVQLLQEQRELRRVTTDWAEFPAWSTARWASASHAALFRQRQIADTLAGAPSSVIGQLVDLGQTIERNRLIRPEAIDRLQAAQELLQDLVEGPLATVDPLLSEMARQTGRSFERETLRPVLAATAKQQDDVIAGLRRGIELLMPGNVIGRLERDLAAIESDQATLAERCRVEIAPRMFESEELKPSQQASLESAVRRQHNLARRLAELVLDLTQAAQRMAEDQPAIAARLAETASLAEEIGLQATIQAAADQLAWRRLGRTATLQQQTLDDLAKLRVRLAGQDALGVADRFKRLQTAERKLQHLRRQVAALERQLKQLSVDGRQRELERLRRQRTKMADQAEAITRALERLRLPEAAKLASEAASQLRRAALHSKTTQQARQQLETAQRLLTAARRRQQVVLARLEMARLNAKLSSLVGRQHAIQQEIMRLEELSKVSGKLTKSQTQTVRQLAVRQADLREEVTTQADELISLPVFAHLLRAASESMHQVKKRLEQSVLAQPTLALAEEAVRQLTLLAEVLQQERQNLAGNKSGEGGDGKGNAGDKAQAQTLQLALGQLKLLKALQTTLRERTQALEEQRSAEQPRTQLASELARQQQQLTELARQLIPEPPDPPATELFPNLEQ